MKETLNPSGVVNIKHYDKNGVLLLDKTINNLIVTAGKQYIASRMVDSETPAPQMSHMGLGASATIPDLSDTALGTQLGRVALTVEGGTLSNNTVTYSATFGVGVAIGNVVEAGIFDSGSGGNMLCRTTFPTIIKGEEDTLAVTWIITVN